MEPVDYMREELTVYPTQQWIIDCRVGYLGLLTWAYKHGSKDCGEITAAQEQKT